MNPIWYDVLAVIVVLMFVGVVLIRAFTAPLPQEDDRIDMFMRRQLPGAPNSANGTTTAEAPRKSRDR